MKAPSDEIYDYDKSTLGTCRLQLCRYLHSFAIQICEISRNSTKIRTYSSSRSLKVIDLGVNRKYVCNFLLLINSNYGHISYLFRDIDAFSSKIACFFYPTFA